MTLQQRLTAEGKWDQVYQNKLDRARKQYHDVTTKIEENIKRTEEKVNSQNKKLDDIKERDDRNVKEIDERLKEQWESLERSEDLLRSTNKTRVRLDAEWQVSNALLEMAIRRLERPILDVISREECVSRLRKLREDGFKSERQRESPMKTMEEMVAAIMAMKPMQGVKTET